MEDWSRWSVWHRRWWIPCLRYSWKNNFRKRRNCGKLKWLDCFRGRMGTRRYWAWWIGFGTTRNDEGRKVLRKPVPWPKVRSGCLRRVLRVRHRWVCPIVRIRQSSPTVPKALSPCRAMHWWQSRHWFWWLSPNVLRWRIVAGISLRLFSDRRFEDSPKVPFLDTRWKARWRKACPPAGPIDPPKDGW